MLGNITLNEPKFESLTLVRSPTFPHEMRLHLRVEYGKAILSLASLSQSEEIRYTDGLCILRSKGHFAFSRLNANLDIDAKFSNVWYDNLRHVELVSEPLSLNEIHEIDEALGSGDIQFRWDVEAWGLMEGTTAAKDNITSAFVHVSLSCPRRFDINRQDFVRNVLEPADLLRRMFIEVIFEPIGSLDGITDPEIRRILETLMSKQKILVEAYTKFINASSSNDYRSVISDVRLAVENLNTAEIRNFLKRAYESIGIAEGAVDRVSEEVSSVIMGQKGNKGSMDTVYRFACKLASHGKTEDNKDYIPRPYRHDAEFALLQVMGILNYLIRVLKMYTLRA